MFFCGIDIWCRKMFYIHSVIDYCFDTWITRAILIVSEHPRVGMRRFFFCCCMLLHMIYLCCKFVLLVVYLFIVVLYCMLLLPGIAIYCRCCSAVCIVVVAFVVVVVVVAIILVVILLATCENEKEYSWHVPVMKFIGMKQLVWKVAHY